MIMPNNNADGQKIAKKLSTQIQKESKKIRSLLPEYNTCLVLLGDKSSTTLTIKEALDPAALVTLFTKPIYVCTQSSSKRELVESFLLIKRASEESVMLTNEMKNVIAYYTHTNATLLKLIQAKQSVCTSALALNRGAVSMLKSKHLAVERELHALHELFGPIIGSSSCEFVQEITYDSDSSDDSSDHDIDHSYD